MKKILLLLLSLLLYSATMHIQSIGICKVQEVNGKLEYSFVFPKENIPKIHASLKNYNDDIKDLLSLQNLIHENISISINNKIVDLKYDTTISELKFVTLKFTSITNKNITSLIIKNKELSFLDEHHTSFDFWLYLQNQKRLFKLNANHTSIKANY